MEDEKMLEALIEQPAQGIRMLTDAYGGLVYALTWRRLSGRLSREDIEECVSDIFLECFQCREKIDLKKGTIKSFLLIIAERRTIKYYERKADKYHTVDIDLKEGMEIASSHNVEQESIKREESRKLLEAVKQLGEPDSTIVIQKYYYGMTAKEIGTGLHLTKNAVEKRCRRSLNKLKVMLAKGGNTL